MATIESLDRHFFETKPRKALRQWARARRINLNNAATVPIVRVHGTKPRLCFRNVSEYVARFTASWEPCAGYSIMPSHHQCNLFGIERHVVLRHRRSKRLMDITPDPEGLRHKIFVPLSRAIVDFDQWCSKEDRMVGGCRHCLSRGIYVTAPCRCTECERSAG